MVLLEEVENKIKLSKCTRKQKIYGANRSIIHKFGRFRDKGKDARKIDIYNQLNLNWNKFVDYVWSFKNKKGGKENE